MPEYNAAPAPLPPSGAPTRPSDATRPRWGPLDALLSVPVVFVGAIIGTIAASVASYVAGYNVFDGVEMPAIGIFIAGLAQQVVQGGWPWVVSRWKGLGLAADWKFRFQAIDLAYGLGLAVLLLIGAWIANTVTAQLVGLEDPSDASNTQILSDNEGSLWVIGIVLIVVIGAPLTEELLFRGLILRAFEKSLGAVWAVILSTGMFTLPHAVSGATLDETLVLFSAIAVIGLILAVAVLKIGRLGPAIVAHMIFNAVGTAATFLA